MSQSELFRVSIDGDDRVVRFDSGAINDDSVSGQLLRQLVPVCEGLQGNSLHVDLDSVDVLCSSGLNSLIQIHRHVRRSGGEVRLDNVSAGVREVLKVTRLERIFRFAGSEPTVVQAPSS